MTQSESSSNRGPINAPRADIADVLSRMPAMDKVKLPVIERLAPAIRADPSGHRGRHKKDPVIQGAETAFSSQNQCND